MAGLSLSLFWTDEELEALWSAPADAPAFRKPHRPPFERRQVAATDVAAITYEPASTASQRLARLAALALGAAARVVHQHEGELGDLDAVAGDGDHGAGMCRGADGAAEAAAAAVRRGAGVREVLMAAGEEWSERAGGTSGALWSAALMALASSLAATGGGFMGGSGGDSGARCHRGPRPGRAGGQDGRRRPQPLCRSPEPGDSSGERSASRIAHLG